MKCVAIKTELTQLLHHNDALWEHIYTVISRYLEVVGTVFYKFKLPEVKINLNFG